MRERVYMVRQIVAAAEKAAGMTPGTINGRRRFKTTQIWRVAVYRIAIDNEHSSANIGRRMGRDHTTVLSALSRWKRCPAAERAAVDKAVSATEAVLRGEYVPEASVHVQRAQQAVDRFTKQSIQRAIDARRRFVAEQNRQRMDRQSLRTVFGDCEPEFARNALARANNQLLAALVRHHPEMMEVQHQIAAE